MASLSEPRLLEGAPFPISIMEVHRRRVRNFDTASGMATLSLEDLQLDAAEASVLKPIAEIIEVSEIIRSVLISMNTNNYQETNGWTKDVGVAGSSALLLLEGILMKGKDTLLRGRWSEKAHTCFENGEAFSMWEASDIDVFVAGRHGETAASFETFQRTFHTRFNRLSTVGGMGYNSVYNRVNQYAYENTNIHITDISINHANLRVSLIQCPFSRTLQEVINNFDIDVCKVIFNPITGLLHTSLETLSGIEEGVARVRDFQMDPNFPSRFQISRCSNTLERMEKYGRRGYKFKEYPSLFAIEEDENVEEVEDEESVEDETTED